MRLALSKKQTIWVAKIEVGKEVEKAFHEKQLKEVQTLVEEKPKKKEAGNLRGRSNNVKLIKDIIHEVKQFLNDTYQSFN